MICADVNEEVLVSEELSSKKTEIVNAISNPQAVAEALKNQPKTFESEEILDINEYEVC